MNNTFTFDVHGHGPGLLPAEGPMLTPNTPKDTGIDRLKEYGVDACVLCAVGDPAAFGAAPRNEYSMVLGQLQSLRSGIAAAKGIILASPSDFSKKDMDDGGSIRVLLGVEGLDFLDGSPQAIESLFILDVRLLGLVHYSANTIGGICMDLRGDPKGPGTEGGLTKFGRAVLKAAEDLHMTIDVTHANEATIQDVIGSASSPILCSHTGPRALLDTPRYISDATLLAIAESKGLIGLWPGKLGAAGPKDLKDFTRMIAYVAELCGIDAVAVGSDFNGVPGYASGYRGPIDIQNIAESLKDFGFSPEEQSAIMGENARRFFSSALPARGVQ